MKNKKTSEQQQTSLSIKEMIKGRSKALNNIENMLYQRVEHIFKRVMEEAEGGNMAATKLLIDKILPDKKERFILIEGVKLESYEDVINLEKKVIQNMISAELTASEAKSLLDAIKYYKDSLFNNKYFKEFDQALKEVKADIIPTNYGRKD